MPNQSDFRFIDLFAGIGGMRRGFEAAGGRCVFTSEWNRYSQETYRANFGTDEIAGDITKIDSRDIPDHEVLVAGFPCQPFSLAGVSKKNALGRAHGFADETQGTLFFDIARILDFHRPEAFLLENVKNLKSHDKGRTLEKIVDVLTKELGYSLQLRVIDAQGFVPQHRERIFLVGFREERGFDFRLTDIPASSTGPKLRSILHPEDGSEEQEEPFTFGPDARVSPRYTLTPKLWAYLQEYARKHRAKGNGFGFGLVGPEDVARTLSARYYKDGAEILVRREDGSPRRLTPRECARLMGFDAPGTNTWVIPVSDTQAYRQFGNAVVPPVIEAIASDMAAALGSRPVSEVQGTIFNTAA
jgi:DNA (cytosine-5)-methyltransferase 1